MRRTFAFLVSVGCSALAACVFNDQGAVDVATASTTGAGGKSTSVTVSTVTGPGATTAASSSSSSGAGGAPICNDGVIEAPETCEPGNMTFPSCVDCSIVHNCGNNTIEPGEACDEASADCVACEVAGGSCASATPLPTTGAVVDDSTATSSLEIPGAFNDSLSPTCATSNTRDIKLYRYDVGPFPSGLFVEAVGDGTATSIAPVLWAFAGCKKDAQQCGKTDPDAFITPPPPSSSLLTIPVAPPGSVFFIAVGDNNALSGTFHIAASPTRLFSDFEAGNEGWSLVSGWMPGSGSHSVTATNPASDATMVSPDIDVIGITDLAITIVSSLTAGASANVIAVPDGGAPLAPVSVTDTAGMPGIKLIHVTLPPATKSMKLTFTLVHGATSPVWDVHRVIVGPG